MSDLSRHEESQRRWLAGYLSPLVGFTVTKTDVVVTEGHELWPQITLTNDNGTEIVIEVSRDEEGNGPGFLFGLPVVVT